MNGCDWTFLKNIINEQGNRVIGMVRCKIAWFQIHSPLHLQPFQSSSSSFLFFFFFFFLSLSWLRRDSVALIFFFFFTFLLLFFTAVTTLLLRSSSYSFFFTTVATIFSTLSSSESNKFETGSTNKESRDSKNYSLLYLKLDYLGLLNNLNLKSTWECNM